MFDKKVPIFECTRHFKCSLGSILSFNKLSFSDLWSGAFNANTEEYKVCSDKMQIKPFSTCEHFFWITVSNLLNNITIREKTGTNNRDKFILCPRVAMETEGRSCSVFCWARINRWPHWAHEKGTFGFPLGNWRGLLTFDMFWLGLSIRSSCHYKQILHYTCLVNCGLAIYFPSMGFF